MKRRRTWPKKPSAALRHMRFNEFKPMTSPENPKLRVLDLFSGIGGFSLGLERAGMETVRFVEIDPFCRRVLSKHWPNVRCDEDITTANFVEGEADVICGGFPCQDVSRAGKRAGITGPDSGLYRELVRAVRLVRPKFAILENVAALLGDGLGDVLGDLAEIGFDSEWDCVPAYTIGAPHERDRIWIIAHADSQRELQPQRSEQDEWGWLGDGSKKSTNAAGEQMGDSGQSWEHRSMGPGVADAPQFRRGSGRQGRPPDSFARIRDQTRRNATDPQCARLAFSKSDPSWNAQPKSTGENGADGQEIWPNEPALCRVDDGIPSLVDRVRALGNSLIPQIPELIGLAILDTLKE